MEYYSPYLDIADEYWEGQLSKFIPQMMDGNDKQSYQMTIVSISTKLHDAHEVIWDGKADAYDNLFGKNTVPVNLSNDEGKIVK